MTDMDSALLASREAYDDRLYAVSGEEKLTGVVGFWADYDGHADGLKAAVGLMGDLLKAPKTTELLKAGKYRLAILRIGD